LLALSTGRITGHGSLDPIPVPELVSYSDTTLVELAHSRRGGSRAAHKRQGCRRMF